MSARPSTRLAALALLPLGLLTACGGSDKAKNASPPTTTAPTGLAKADFIVKAEAICAKANATIEAQPQPASAAAFVAAFADTIRLAENTTTELETLAADQPDKSTLDSIFLTAIRGQVTALTAYGPQLNAAAAKGEAAVQALPEPVLPDADLTAMKAYGFSACVTLAENS